MWRLRQLRCFLFQSTRPLRGATAEIIKGLSAQVFQSTRPLRGATLVLAIERLKDRISIHAPLAGRDCSSHPRAPENRNFNPRAPCGARRAQGCCTAARPRNFNPRAPCGARRQKRAKIFLRLCDNRQISADFSANHRLSKRFTSAFQKKRGRFPVRSSRQFSARLRFARDDHCHSERSITPSVCRSRRTGDALRPR